MDEKKEQAFRSKEAGNLCYKKKSFDSAIEHYKKAIELDSQEITFYTNLGAVYFEQKEYNKCIETCKEGVEVGRNNRADFKVVAKALTRIGNAYKHLEDLENAKFHLEKSLTEHRTPATQELLTSVERTIKERERLAYEDPEKAAEEKTKGNQLFQKGDYAGAVKCYSEAIKRHPQDAKLYSNRAAAYTKLAAFDLGLKDCDQCIKLDPQFIKGFLRKANLLKAMKQYSKAMDTYQEALDIDSNCQEATDGYRACLMEQNKDPEEVRKRAMGDPEVQRILQDPAMRLILEQMQSDPKALRDHLQNPDVAQKIQKLMEAGLIAIK